MQSTSLWDNPCDAAYMEIKGRPYWHALRYISPSSFLLKGLQSRNVILKFFPYPWYWMKRLTISSMLFTMPKVTAWSALIESSSAFADALSLLNRSEDTPAAVKRFCSASEMVFVSPVLDFSKLILLIGMGERTLPISSGSTESRLRQNSLALSKSICHSPSSLIPSVITSMA